MIVHFLERDSLFPEYKLGHNSIKFPKYVHSVILCVRALSLRSKIRKQSSNRLTVNAFNRFWILFYRKDVVHRNGRSTRDLKKTVSKYLEMAKCYRLKNYRFIWKNGVLKRKLTEQARKNNEENRNGFNVRGKEDTCRILKAISYYNK